MIHVIKQRKVNSRIGAINDRGDNDLKRGEVTRNEMKCNSMRFYLLKISE